MGRGGGEAESGGVTAGVMAPAESKRGLEESLRRQLARRMPLSAPGTEGMFKKKEDADSLLATVEDRVIRGEDLPFAGCTELQEAS